MGEETRRVCRNCGTPLPPGARFCEECGTDAEAAAAAAEVKTHGDQTPINEIRAREAEQNRNPAPQPGRDPAPNPGYNPAPNPGYNPTPNPGYNPTPNPGYNPTPNPGYNPTPNPGYNPTPNPYDPYTGWNPPQKKKKTWLFVLIGAVAVVAITLILIFVVIKPGAQQTTPENMIVGTWYSYMAVDTSTDSMSTLDRNVWVLTINAGGTAQSSINGVVTEGRWSYVATNDSGNYTYQYQDATGSFQMAYVVNGNEIASTGDVWMQVGTTVFGFKR